MAWVHLFFPLLLLIFRRSPEWVAWGNFRHKQNTTAAALPWQGRGASLLHLLHRWWRLLSKLLSCCLRFRTASYHKDNQNEKADTGEEKKILASVGLPVSRRGKIAKAANCQYDNKRAKPIHKSFHRLPFLSRVFFTYKSLKNLLQFVRIGKLP